MNLHMLPELMAKGLRKEFQSRWINILVPLASYRSSYSLASLRPMVLGECGPSNTGRKVKGNGSEQRTDFKCDLTPTTNHLRAIGTRLYSY